MLKKYSDVYLYMLVYKEHALGINKKLLRVVPWGIGWEQEQGWTSKHSLPTTQEKTLHVDITRWSIPKSDWLYSLHQRWRNSIQSVKTRLGADCGSDHELLIAKFRLKSKKVGKTARPFRYDLNQVP